MKAKIKEAWINALESGEYGQLTGSLISEDGTEACCLGVLYDTCREGDWVRMKDHNGFDVWGVPGRGVVTYPESGECSRDTMPTKKILEDMGLTLRDADILAQMNDKGESFHQIAEYIRENL